ncbi:MAG: hypothetical protein JW720_10090 [Sedimentisphaerales bacterium]|nr:hypothetical protein [Sedimentisphaerales bacterium]
MNSKSKFEGLIACARSERAPKVDVAGRVLAVLSGDDVEYQPSYDRPLMWLAGLSSAVAASVSIAAVFVYQAWTDPLFELSRAISLAVK